MTSQIRIIAPAIAGALIAAAAPAAAQVVGVNAAVVNDVRMKTDADPSVHRAAVKERVSLGNDIATGASSRLQVLLLDRTSFTVGANARLKVDRFVYDPNRSASSVGLSVTRGAFRFMSGKPLHANPGASQINTPVASIGIRGTIVELAVGEDALALMKLQPGLPGFNADPATASLIFLRGPGSAAQGGETVGAIDVTAGGTTATISGSGSAFFVPGPGQPPIGPFTLSPDASALFAAMLGSRRSGKGGAFDSPLVPNPLIDQYFEVNADEFRQPVNQVPSPTGP
jgi:hypothetical protein